LGIVVFAAAIINALHDLLQFDIFNTCNSWGMKNVNTPMVSKLGKRSELLSD